MKLIQNHDAVTIVTAITAEAFAKASRYAPESLLLKNDKTVTFAIARAPQGSVNKNGIAFDGVDATGKLYVTLADENFGSKSPEEARAAIEDTFGMVMYNLKLVEAQVVASIESTAAAIATVTDSIIISE